MKSVKKAIASSTGTLKRAIGFGDKKDESKNNRTCQDDALRYLYGDFDDVYACASKVSTCHEAKEQKETCPVKLAEVEIGKVEDSLSSLVGRIQLLPEAENPFECGAIEEELNRLLFRLDDIETRDNVDLKTMRTRSLKQVQGALQNLHKDDLKIPRDESQDSTDSSMDLSEPFETLDITSIEVVPQKEQVADNDNISSTSPTGISAQDQTPDKVVTIPSANNNIDSQKELLSDDDNISPAGISAQDQSTEEVITVDIVTVDIVTVEMESQKEQVSDNDSISPTTPVHTSVQDQTTDEVINGESVSIDGQSYYIVESFDLTLLDPESTIKNCGYQVLSSGLVNETGQNSTTVDENDADCSASTSKSISTTEDHVNGNTILKSTSNVEITAEIVADDQQVLNISEVVSVENCNEGSTSNLCQSADSNFNNTSDPSDPIHSSANTMSASQKEVCPTALTEVTSVNTVEDPQAAIASAAVVETTPSALEPDKQQYRPVQLLVQDSEGRFSLDEEALMHILGHDSVKNRKLAVISIVGAFRRGKSFLMNFILRYLQANGASNWLEGDVEHQQSELNGFSWQGGMDRDTTGILMWSKPFLIGNDLAVVLVDTQGTYDSKTSMKDSSFIFTLSTLISSVQIFNLSERIQMDDLTNLQHFLEFGRMVQDCCDSKVFEKLIFLVRDWKFPRQMSFGFQGGNVVLDEWFKNPKCFEQVDMVKTCFDKIECFLMPYPGEKVSCDEYFKGDLTDIRPEFLSHLKTFVEGVMEDICVKKIGESFFMAGDLLVYLKTFIERLQDPKLEPKTLLKVLSDIALEKARKKAENFYTREMKSQLRVCGNLTELHNATLNKALQIFEESYAFRGTEFANVNKNTLKEVLIERSKHIFQHVVESEVSMALTEYRTCITTFCIGKAGDFSITLQDAHDRAHKVAYQKLKSRLEPLVDKQQLDTELAVLKKRAEELCATMEPVYELQVHKETMKRANKEEEWRKDQAMKQQLHSLEIRSNLSEVASRAAKQYRMAMENYCMDSRVISSQEFQNMHKREWKRALSAFEKFIQTYSLNECKSYIDQVKVDIGDSYSHLQSQQKKKYTIVLKEAHATAVCKYQKSMDALNLGEQLVSDLQSHHETAVHEALSSFQTVHNGSDLSTSFYNHAIKDIQEKFRGYKKMSDKCMKLHDDKELFKLHSAMKDAAHSYQSEMLKRLNTIQSHLELSNHHSVIREKCIADFQLAVAECNPEKKASKLVELLKEIEFEFQGIEESEGRKLSLLRENELKRTGKKNYPIGIDLGTTNCCVAVYEEGRVKIMKNNIGKNTTPSTVYFETDGHTFGESAIARGFADPKNCISEMKRIIGRQYEDPVVQTLKGRWSFDVQERDGDPAVQVTKGKQKQILPEEISGLMLSEMKRLASVYLDSEVFDAVVTIPAYFNEMQREATKRACAQAGINLLRIINEPTAAAIAYGLQTNAEDSCTVLVFDFGGGTCDVSILEMERGRYQVKASQGDNQLGGEDFDDNLTDYLASIYQQKHGVTLKNTDLRRLRRQCEKSKRDLTCRPVCEVHVEFMREGMADLRENITRKEFDRINADLYPRVLEPVKKCLESAGMEVDDIDNVVLVGGSSRMKKVQDLLKEFFPSKEIIIRINPDEAIAYGAAIQAALSSGLYCGKLHVIDITPMSLGIATKQGANWHAYSIITPRNTELPSKYTKRYTTIFDQQESMLIRVYQGEHTEDEYMNTRIGEFTLCDLTKAPAGETVVNVTFEIDEDGILEVTAQEVSNCANCKSVRIQKCVK